MSYVSAPVENCVARVIKMPFETRIRELSKQLANCRDDALSLELARELQTVLHERIEQLRDRLAALPLVAAPSKVRRKPRP
jgi:hypothetical protein